VSADDRRGIRQRIFHDFFVTYGAGSAYLERFTRSKAWNLISWVLIVIGVLGWVAFLFWKPS
jgi:hypothetical protein